MTDNKTNLPMFCHIPTPDEARLYFHDLLSMNPRSAQVHYLCLFLGIHGINQIQILPYKGGDRIRFLTKTYLQVLEPGSKTWKEIREEYLVDLVLERFTDDDDIDETFLSISQEHRMRLFFKPCERGEGGKASNTAASEECLYGIEGYFGAAAFYPYMVPTENPAHLLFEGSMRWMAAEASKNTLEHMGDSAICLARFIDTDFLKMIRDAFGEYAHAHAEILDANTARVHISLPLDDDMHEFFVGSSLGVDVGMAFHISLLKPEFPAFLYLDFYSISDDEWPDIKVNEIHAYAKEAIRDQPRWKPIDINPVDENTPFAVCDPYAPDFLSKKGRTQFVGHLLVLARQAVEGFKKAAERRTAEKKAVEQRQ